MRARTFFEELTDTPETFYKYGSFRDFQIFIPEKAKILGYFKDKEFSFSERKFYSQIDPSKFKELEKKVSKNKFICEINFDEDVLDSLVSSLNDADEAKKQVKREYQNVESFLKLMKI